MVSKYTPGESVGDSAGGNLAAVVSMRLRDERFTPPVKLQFLLYPALQALDFTLPSFLENQDDPLLPKDLMVAMWMFYAQGKYHISQHKKKKKNKTKKKYNTDK